MANPLIPVETSREIMKVAIESSAVLQLCKKVNMGSQLKDMPVLNVKPSAYWVTGDTGLKQTSGVQWKNVRLIAEELAVLVPIPLNVLADSSVDMWAQIKPEVGEAIGVALDAAVLFGTAAPPNFPVGGLSAIAVAANNTVAHGTAVAPHDVATDISNVIASVESDGFNPTGIIMAQAMRAQLRMLRSTTGEFIFQSGDPGVTNTMFGSSAGARTGTVLGLPARTSMTNVFETSLLGATGTYLFAADWDQVVIGVREDMQVYYSRDAIITDGANAIQYNAFQQDLMIGRFVARFAMAVPNPVTRLQPTMGSRAPVGVLRELT